MATPVQLGRKKPLISGANELLEVRKATRYDIDSIKKIADAHRDELGFVLRPALLASIDRGEVTVVQVADNLVGFMEYHHRQDEQTTLYHILVIPSMRGKGIGRLLIETLTKEATESGHSVVKLKCPANLPANRFYEHIGARLHTVENGKSRDLIVWLIPVRPA